MLRVLIALILVLAAGCERQSETSATRSGESSIPTKVKLALNWVPEPEFGGIYAARENSLFAQQGLDVDILGGGAGAPVVQMIATGQVEFGIASADEIIMARSRGMDLVGLFATYQDCPQGIMTHAARSLRDLAEVFQGGTLAIEPGLPYAAWLRHKYGFEKIKIVPYDGGIARFIADPNFAQQCFIFSEPIAARRQGAQPKVFLVADSGYNPYTAVVTTRSEYLRQNPRTVAGLVAALRGGWRAYLDNPAPANAVMGKLNTSMDAATFTAAAEAQKPLVESADLGHMTAERWTTLIEQLKTLKLIDKAPAAAECFVNP